MRIETVQTNAVDYAGRLMPKPYVYWVFIVNTWFLLVLTPSLWGAEVNSLKERRSGINPPNSIGLAIGDRIPDW
jgi:hypothetical protein